MALSGKVQMLNGVCIHRPDDDHPDSVIGMKTFQPRRMIWS